MNKTLNTTFLNDVLAIRLRAREHIEGGAVTEGDRKSVV